MNKCFSGAYPLVEEPRLELHNWPWMGLGEVLCGWSTWRSFGDGAPSSSSGAQLADRSRSGLVTGATEVRGTATSKPYGAEARGCVAVVDPPPEQSGMCAAGSALLIQAGTYAASC